MEEIRAAFAAAFEKWLREYQADPSKFSPIEGVEPKTYGEACADHFIAQLNDLSGWKPWASIGAPPPVA